MQTEKPDSNNEKRVIEREHVIDILTRAKKAIKDGDIAVLKDLSNQTVHSSSIFQDANSISIAVIIYAISKLFEREKYKEYREWPLFADMCIKSISSAIDDLKKNNIEQFRNDLMNIRLYINKISGHFRYYIEDVFRKAMISKASRLYEHGISVEQTAKLLGISVFELVEYAGKTGIADVDLSITLDIGTRLKKAFALFEQK